MNLSRSSRLEKVEFTLWPLASFLHQNYGCPSAVSLSCWLGSYRVWGENLWLGRLNWNSFRVWSKRAHGLRYICSLHFYLKCQLPKCTYVYYMRKGRESNLFSTPNLASIISYDECIRMYMYVIHCTYLARLPLYSEVVLKAFQI